MRQIVCFKSLSCLNTEKMNMIVAMQGKINKTSVQIAGKNFRQNKVLIVDVQVSTYKDDKHFVNVTVNCCTTGTWFIPVLDIKGETKFIGAFETTNMGFITNSDISFVGVL